MITWLIYFSTCPQNDLGLRKLSVVFTPQMSHICGIWCTILIRRPKFIGKLQSWTKVLGKIFIFFRHFWVPSYTVKLGKHSGYTRPTLFLGGREGLDLCELENALEMQKCPKTFFRDCSFKLSFWVFFTSTSKAENNYSEYTNRICLWHQELAWKFYFCGRCSEVTKETTSFL